MIYCLQGTPIKLGIGFVVLNVSGVGYKIFMSPNAISLNAPTTIYTYLAVREDAMTLYGFHTEAEQSLFELLLGVSGIGPKAAMSIITTFQPDEFKRYCIEADAKAISAAPGIGVKAASKIILEISGKLDYCEGLETPVSAPSDARNAVDALVSLGYAVNDARRVVDSLKSKGLPSEELIKQALQLL